MSLMLDSSATLAWIYANEITEPIRNVFDLVRENGAWAPGLWKLEGANILEMGVRRGRHDAAFSRLHPWRSRSPADLDRCRDGPSGVGRHAPLVRAPPLDLYDAAYLELALRRGLPLASLDTELRGAARAEDVVVLGS